MMSVTFSHRQSRTCPVRLSEAAHKEGHCAYCAASEEPPPHPFVPFAQQMADDEGRAVLIIASPRDKEISGSPQSPYVVFEDAASDEERRLPGNVRLEPRRK